MNPLVRIMACTAGSLALALVVPILLIHAQPYDGSIVEDLLMPPAGCPAPCFLGMRPGETPLSEALAFFEQQSDLVFFVERGDPADGVVLVQWRDPQTTLNGVLHFVDGHLVELSLSGLPLYEIWLALGEPDGTQMVNEMMYIDDQRFILLPTVHSGYYVANSFQVNFTSACTHFWYQPAYIVLGQTVLPDRLNNAQSLAEQRQIACEQQRAFLRVQQGAG